MSKRINVNPGQYKVAGRERPGNAAIKDPKQTFAVERAQERRGNPRRSRPKAKS